MTECPFHKVALNDNHECPKCVRDDETIEKGMQRAWQAGYDEGYSAGLREGKDSVYDRM